MDSEKTDSTIYQNGKLENCFVIMKKIGRGAFGSIVKARRKFSNKTYAIKTVYITDDIDFSLREINLLKGLRNEYIVKYVDSWLENDDKNKLYLQMELCDLDLRSLIHRIEDEFICATNHNLDTMGYFIASELFREILEGVGYLHKQIPPIIHRDLKPTNIFITNGLNKSYVKIGDFGLSVTHEYEQQSHTEAVGSYSFLAPEVLTGRRYDTKADIYSLGCIARMLFRVDLNEDVTDLFTSIVDIIQQMIDIRAHGRPTCQWVLTESQTWCLNREIIESDNNFNNMIAVKEDFQVDFLPIFIQKKLNHPNYKLSIKSIEQKQFFSSSRVDGNYSKNFEEFGLLGWGTFSVVHEARSLKDDKNYAIKIIPVTKINIKQLERELIIMKDLTTENMVNYVSTWTEFNQMDEKIYKKYKESGLKEDHVIFNRNHTSLLYIQMELCYYTLRQVIEQTNKLLKHKEKNELSTTGYYIYCELLMEIFEGVQFLHNQPTPIVHRDLKPNNILITRGFNGKFVKIGDFGTAKLLESVTQINTNCGTLKYMAPEVPSGLYDGKVDIYSLGVTIQQLFNIDINGEISQENDGQFTQMYKNLFDLSLKMIQPRKNLRPYWKEIFSQKQSWFLSLSQYLKNEPELQKIKAKIESTKYLEDIFYLLFMETKLNQFSKAEEGSKSSSSTGEDIQTPIGSKSTAENKITTGIEQDFENFTLIGIGSFTIVLKAKNKQDDSMYAIKKIPVNEKLITRISELLKRTGKLDDNHTIQYFRSWSESNNFSLNSLKELDRKFSTKHELLRPDRPILLTIQMELLQCNLETLIERINSELNQSTKNLMTLIGYYISSEILTELLESVDYLHQLDLPIIHTNLNLTNILITDGLNGRIIKLADIVSSFFYDFDEMLLQSHHSASKFFAKELFRNKPFSCATDIYSIGIIIEELFNLNTKRNINEKNHHLFKTKYENVWQLSQTMSSPDANMRPTAKRALKQKELWQLSIQDALKDVKTIEENKMCSLEDSAHMFILQMKRKFSK